MMTDYTRLIEMIDTGHDDGTFSAPTQKPCLVLDEKARVIAPEEGFNTLIGLTNEINTNIITFKAPDKIEGHQIATCDHAVVKWHNLASGEKGCDDLNIEALEGQALLSWIVPVEAMTKAGNLKVSISIYDEDETNNNRVTFRWNSLPYQGLTIGQGMDEVSVGSITDDSIIYIDLYSRKITIPSGLNTQIGLIGELFLNKLKFRCDRYYQDKDFLDMTFYILYDTPNGESRYQQLAGVTLIDGTPDSGSPNTHSDLLEFEFAIPPSWTSAEGIISFAIQVEQAPEDGGITIWSSETNSSLSIGSGLSRENRLPEGEDATFINFEDLVYVFDAGDASEFITE